MLIYDVSAVRRTNSPIALTFFCMESPGFSLDAGLFEAICFRGGDKAAGDLAGADP